MKKMECSDEENNETSP